MTDDEFMELLGQAAFGENPSMGAIDFLIAMTVEAIAKLGQETE